MKFLRYYRIGKRMAHCVQYWRLGQKDDRFCGDCEVIELTNNGIFCNLWGQWLGNKNPYVKSCRLKKCTDNIKREDL